MRRISAFVLTSIILLSTSCLKTKSNSNTNNPASIAFVNVAPGAPPFQVSVDDAKVGTQADFPYGNYPMNADSSIKYLQEFAGIHSVAFIDDTTTSSNNILVSGQTQFSKGFKYTIYLYDTVNANGLNAVQLQDTYDSIPYNQCLFRFLNFSPNSPPLSVIAHYPDDTLVTILNNQSYVGSASYSTASLSQYITIPPAGYGGATKPYVITLSQYNGFNTTPGPPVVDSFSMALAPNHAYTLVITGLIGDSTDSKGYQHFLIHMN
ncbi:MAG TPA: DUF4397 domain-containing protein [Dinghuibacter sp.]|uniref:DUF4397 domain-containing protein n=1 Tax=Dinghuibacter sp. TaxID=2024697 RepID=UPI002B650E64|nr:DUF4397 domain-containing protein [Dinghuibacter sp.]HTJ14467.1 DUF4397 domain-containing protein [Dinghuibacter sp.]